jgi:hypothetical protein
VKLIAGKITGKEGEEFISTASDTLFKIKFQAKPFPKFLISVKN